MRVFSAWGIGVLAFVAAGCSCGAAHEIDDARVAADAFAAGDAGLDVGPAPADTGLDAFVPPEGEHYFTLEPARVDLIITNERCSTQEGTPAILRVTVHFFSTCDTPGPVDAILDASAHTVTIVPHLWRAHGRTDCASVGAAYVRDVSVAGLTAGVWSVIGASTSSTLTVFARAGIVCPAPGLGTIATGAACREDCECMPGLSCIAIRGDAVCERLCGDPCEDLGVGRDLSLSCAPGNSCSNDPNVGWTCASSMTDECSDANACPSGMACPPVTEGPRQCIWSIALDGSTRHPCVTESDCGAGLDCVQRADGRRACEVRCTTSDMSCPNNAPHACMTGNWICEWLGE